MEEQECRRSKSSTFTEPLKKTPDMKEFLTSFYKKIYTDQQRAIYREELDGHPILKSHFDVLVPGIISYEDFWQRYDYRCDVERIMTQMKEDNPQSISKSLGSVRQRIIDMATDVKASAAGPLTSDTTPEILEQTPTIMSNVALEEETPKPEVIEDLLAAGDNKGDQPRPIALQYLEATEGSLHQQQQDASVISDGVESQSAASTAKHAVHVYPESPEMMDDERSRDSMKQPPPDDRLVGTQIFMLNNIDEDITEMIRTLGGSLTDNVEDATHALWIPNPEREYTSCVEALIAASLNIPIVDSDAWLPRMSRLDWDEHWSDINCEQFLPISTKPLKPLDPATEKEIFTKHVEPRQHVRRARGLMKLLVVLVAVMFVVSNRPSSIEESCRPARPGTFLELFCDYAHASPISVERLEKTKTPWWKKLVARTKRKKEGKMKK